MYVKYQLNKERSDVDHYDRREEAQTSPDFWTPPQLLPTPPWAVFLAASAYPRPSPIFEAIHFSRELYTAVLLLLLLFFFFAGFHLKLLKGYPLFHSHSHPLLSLPFSTKPLSSLNVTHTLLIHSV